VTEPEAFALLRGLVDAERLRIGVNIRMMNSPGSPAFRRQESAIPIVAGIALSLGATSLAGWWLGAVVITGFCVLWFRFLYPKVRDRVFDRTTALALRSSRDFTALWQRGALSLHTDTEQCLSPRGDWITFVAARA
jgi:hypothetical protein